MLSLIKRNMRKGLAMLLTAAILMCGNSTDASAMGIRNFMDLFGIENGAQDKTGDIAAGGDCTCASGAACTCGQGSSSCTSASAAEVCTCTPCGCRTEIPVTAAPATSPAVTEGPVSSPDLTAVPATSPAASANPAGTPTGSPAADQPVPAEGETVIPVHISVRMPFVAGEPADLNKNKAVKKMINKEGITVSSFRFNKKSRKTALKFFGLTKKGKLKLKKLSKLPKKIKIDIVNDKKKTAAVITVKPKVAAHIKAVFINDHVLKTSIKGIKGADGVKVNFIFLPKKNNIGFLNNYKKHVNKNNLTLTYRNNDKITAKSKKKIRINLTLSIKKSGKKAAVTEIKNVTDSLAEWMKTEIKNKK